MNVADISYILTEVVRTGLNNIIDALTNIRDNFDSPTNNDAFYGKVDCLLNDLIH